MRVCQDGRCPGVSVPGRRALRDELLEAGAWLPSGCRNGNCGICEARLLEGGVEQLASGAPVAPGESFMLCTTRARGDASLHADSLHMPGEHRRETVWATLLARQPLCPRWIRLQLQLPAGKRLPVFAGQGIELRGPEGSVPVHLAAPPSRELECWLDATLPEHAPLLAGAPPPRLEVTLPWGNLMLRHQAGELRVIASPVRLPQALGLLRQHALWRSAARQPARGLLHIIGKDQVLPVALPEGVRQVARMPPATPAEDMLWLCLGLTADGADGPGTEALAAGLVIED